MSWFRKKLFYKCGCQMWGGYRTMRVKQCAQHFGKELSTVYKEMGEGTIV